MVIAAMMTVSGCIVWLPAIAAPAHSLQRFDQRRSSINFTKAHVTQANTIFLVDLKRGCYAVTIF